MNFANIFLRLRYSIAPKWALDKLWKSPPFHFSPFYTQALYKDVERGYDILYYECSLADETFYFKDFQLVEQDPAVSRLALEYLHSFEWLQDLSAINTQVAREREEELLKSWLAVTDKGYNIKHSYAYKSSVVVRRLINWLTCINFNLIKDNKLKEDLIQATSFQVRLILNLAHTLDDHNSSSSIAVQIKSLEAQYIFGYCTRFAKVKSNALNHLIRLLTQHLLSDGGIIGESPSNLLQILGSLSLVFKSLGEEEEETKNDLRKYIDRLITCILSLRYLDGKLATFAGGYEENAKKISFILASFPLLADDLPKVRRLHSGYMGLKSPNINVVVKTGDNTNNSQARPIEPDLMSSEIYIGLQRVFVSGSLIVAGDKKTFTYSNAEFKDFGKKMGFASQPQSKSSFKSNESWDILLTECSNYLGHSGLKWSKQIELSKECKEQNKTCEAGLCMLCEDLISFSSEEEKLTGWFKFVLHPSVCHKATMSEDKQTIFMNLSSTTWAFRFSSSFQIKKEYYTGFQNTLHETLVLYIHFTKQSSIKLELQIAPKAWLQEVSKNYQKNED